MSASTAKTEPQTSLAELVAALKPPAVPNGKLKPGWQSSEFLAIAALAVNAAADGFTLPVELYYLAGVYAALRAAVKISYYGFNRPDRHRPE